MARVCLFVLIGCTLVSLVGCKAPTAKSDAIRVEPPLPPAKPTEREKERRYAAAYERGLAVARRGNVGVAVGFFEEAVSLRPESAPARLALGACYEQMGDPLRAIQQYRIVLGLNPDDADAYANLGTAYMKLYEREKNDAWRSLACAAWRRSLELRPRQRDVQSYLASAESPRD